MNIETARRIVADSSLAPSQADWMLAGRVLYDHWQRHPEELRPGEAGRLTYDAATPRRESSAAAVASVRALTARIDKLSKRRTLTRDQDPARKLMQLPGHAAAYRVATDSDGKVWLEQLEGAQTGKPPPAADPDLMEADPPLKMGPTEQNYAFGDLARHRRATAARDRGAELAKQLNAKARAHWGQ
jgi:hypothetical protein